MYLSGPGVNKSKVTNFRNFMTVTPLISMYSWHTHAIQRFHSLFFPFLLFLISESCQAVGTAAAKTAKQSCDNDANYR